MKEVQPDNPAAAVWLIDLTAARTQLENAEARAPGLSATDHTRLGAIASPAERELRRLATIALRWVLEHRFGTGLRARDLPRDTHGRPHLPSGLPAGVRGAFSLAHAGHHALIAVTSGQRIGVDLECPRQIRMAPPRRARIEQAAALLSPAPLPPDDPGRFLLAWTRLEALAKADGRGIGRLLTAVGAVGGGPPDPAAARALAASLGLTLHDMDAGQGFSATAAVEGNKKPAFHRWPAGLEY